GETDLAGLIGEIERLAAGIAEDGSSEADLSDRTRALQVIVGSEADLPGALLAIRRLLHGIEGQLPGEARDPGLVVERELARLSDETERLIDAVLHHPDFRKLEDTWQGLYYLVANSETGPTLKICAFQLTKEELKAALAEAPETDQSDIARLVYE